MHQRTWWFCSNLLLWDSLDYINVVEMTTFQLVLFQMNGGSQGWSNHVVKRASKLNLVSLVPCVPFFFLFATMLGSDG